MIQVLTIPDFPNPTVARALSPNGRANRWLVTKAKNVVRDNVTTYAIIQGLQRMRGLVHLTPVFVYPDQRKRDDDNLATGVMKASRDSLVRGGWLEADDSKHLIQARAEPRVIPGKRYLELTFEYGDDTSPTPIDNVGS